MTYINLILTPPVGYPHSSDFRDFAVSLYLFTVLAQSSKSETRSR